MKQPEISIAPMMDWTDRHCRYFLRLIAADVLLYTEMITAQALKYGDKDYLLGFDAREHPIALQLGGSDPELLAQAAVMGEEAGYDEINLNLGCPSPRVSAGRFGACLMYEPTLVADCIAAMAAKVSLPVTVKCRIGVDDHDSYQALHHFMATVAEAGCKKIIVHARKAWLKGLSPKENREIPPLQYEVVHQVKRDFPHLKIILNGGIKNLEEIQAHIDLVDGFMIGRAAYQNPYCLAAIQAHFFPQSPVLSREQVVLSLLPYVKAHLDQGGKLSQISKHLHGLFQGEYGANRWRRYLSTHAHQAGANEQILEQALDYMTAASL